MELKAAQGLATFKLLEQLGLEKNGVLNSQRSQFLLCCLFLSLTVYTKHKR